MPSSIVSLLLTGWTVVFVVLVLAVFVVWLGARVISEAQSGLVIKRFGAELLAPRWSYRRDAR